MKLTPRFLAALVFALLAGGHAAAADQDLAQGFAAPPESAKPWTWWHWVSGNISEEGITADLEAMKKVGLGGVENFTVDQSDVKGPVAFMSADWRKLVHDALTEAAHLQLSYAMEGCDGWSESGGPWVPASESMQTVVWTERQITGGQEVALDLPQPETRESFYQDIALLAFPTPLSDSVQPSKVTASDPAFDGSKLADSTPMLVVNDPAAAQWIQVEYGDAASFGSVHFTAVGENSAWEVQASDDGGSFRKLTTVNSGTSATFPNTTAKFYRVWVKSLPPEVKQLRIAALRFGGPMLDELAARTGNKVALDANHFVDLALSPTEAVDAKKIIDLTGQSQWQAPAGAWTLLRLGHTSTGATTHPSTSAGLECDKLSADAVQHHIQNMFGPVFADSPDLVGTTLKYILLDSWECGCENWTPRLAAEFRQRRGYDLGPWLPALTGKIIDSAEMTQRFLWDYRRTLADLLAEEHYGTIQNYAHEHQMGLTSEAPGIGEPTLADALQCKGQTDIPMGEFWVNLSRDGNIDDPKEAASAAHIYGQNIAATESFTSEPKTASWTNDPASLKALGDEEFCLGVNRFVFHRYAHQPWLDRKPGMSMGPWGINFERTNTWWEQGSAWLSYLSRCQYLLQQGHFAADLCYFYGEGAPAFFHHSDLTPQVPKGYDYDVCNAEILLNFKVADGRLVLPSGMSYRVLILPPTDRMTLPVLQKVADLVEAGAVVYGPKPLRSPTLTGYPETDQAISGLADKVWGPCDGKTVTEHPYGKGKVVWGQSLEQAVAVAPDFQHAAGDLLYIHRHDNPNEIFFVSNQGSQGLTTECTFRVSGLTPELWHADTGERETVALYKTNGGLTTLPLHLDPIGSVFVVFRKAATESSQVSELKLDGKDFPGSDTTAHLPVVSDDHVELTTSRPGKYEITTGDGKILPAEVPALPAPVELSGPWQLTFPPKEGAPEKTNFEQLISWTDSTDDGVKYFSGTATYTKDFDLARDFLAKDRHVWLDLGQVKNLAEVTVNGKNRGILWKAPFQVEITDAVQSGPNHLEIKVTNLWPNRLIGDQKIPEAQRTTWTSVSLYQATSPLLPSGLLGPVKISAAQQISF